MIRFNKNVVTNVFTILGCAFGVLLASSLPVMAGTTPIIFTINSPTLTLNGVETLLTGSIQYTGSDEIFLNNIVVTLDGDAQTYIVPDTNAFFDNVIGSLTAAEPTYSGAIFGVLPELNTPAGFYSGSVTLLGGPLPLSSLNTLATATFQINAAAAPEPGAAALCFLAAPFAVSILARRKRRL